MPRTARYARTVPRRSVTDELLKQIGQRIQWLREATGHTQAQWARALKVTPQKLNKWEAGTRTPNLDDLVIIVKSTRASFDYLFLGRLTYEMNPELLEHLFEAHGDQLELGVLPPRLPPSSPPAAPRSRRRKKPAGDGNPGRHGVGT